MEDAAITSVGVPLWAWGVLAGVVLLSLCIDLFWHRGDHGLSKRCVILWSVAWIALALAFAGFIALWFGRGRAEDYLTAYLIEKSLSVDNLFIFMLIFSRLKINPREQHRVLSWGILGAFVTRAAFIGGGTALLAAWHSVVYGLGIFLIYTGVKTLRQRPDDCREDKILPFIRRHFPFSNRLHGHRFFAIEKGRCVATPLLLALIVIEITDVIFALDSIPAVFAISLDPFIVYSSNIFAILGLRALYLVLAELLAELEYLRYGLGAILIFAGAKMLTSQLFHISHLVSLLTVLGILAAAVVPSLLVRHRTAQHRV